MCWNSKRRQQHIPVTYCTTGFIVTHRVQQETGADIRKKFKKTEYSLSYPTPYNFMPAVTGYNLIYTSIPFYLKACHLGVSHSEFGPGLLHLQMTSGQAQKEVGVPFTYWCISMGRCLLRLSPWWLVWNPHWLLWRCPSAYLNTRCSEPGCLGLEFWHVLWASTVNPHYLCYGFWTFHSTLFLF